MISTWSSDLLQRWPTAEQPNGPVVRLDLLDGMGGLTEHNVREMQIDDILRLTPNIFIYSNQKEI